MALLAFGSAGRRHDEGARQMTVKEGRERRGALRRESVSMHTTTTATRTLSFKKRSEWSLGRCWNCFGHNSTCLLLWGI
jgi:hypothetical protein